MKSRESFAREQSLRRGGANSPAIWLPTQADDLASSGRHAVGLDQETAHFESGSIGEISFDFFGTGIFEM